MTASLQSATSVLPAPGPLGRHRRGAAAGVLTTFAVATAACWLVAPPPSAPSAILVASGAHRVSVLIDPRRGCSSAVLRITGLGGRPLPRTPVQLQAVMPLIGLALPATDATTSSDSVITAPLCLPLTGPWEVRAAIGGRSPDVLVIPLNVTG